MAVAGGSYGVAMLFAPTCPLCRTRGQALCAGCLKHLKPVESSSSPPGVDLDRSLFSYEGRARRLITGLKYANNRATLPTLSRALAHLATEGSTARCDVVTWVPTTAVRRRRRGFDQAELLARAVAKELSLPARSLLVHRPGPAQTGRDLAARRLGPAFSYRDRSPDRVLLVDDVVTSGATASAAAMALRAAGAGFVVLVTVARTPRRRAEVDLQRSGDDMA